MSSGGNWEQLKKDYAERGIALALGAGVSMGCQLPNWCQLLERIAEQCLGADGRQIVDEMIREGFTLPAIAGILEAERPPNSDFGEIIRDALYRDFKYYRQKFRAHDLTEFVAFIKANNPTLSAVAALCVKKEGPAANYIANSSVHAIANFNFDAILRVYAKARYQQSVILRTIERPSARALPERINIYHVHGFFQFNEGYIGKATREAPDIRVFTEHEYFDFFNQPNSLFNYTFLYLLREYSMLFIGMSLKDDNVRRLLHYSRKENRESYEKEGVAPEKAERKTLRHYAIQKRMSSRHLNKIIETSLHRLGVRTLWVDDFNEVPLILKELYESTGNVWSDVY